jgi:hypothetical protein
MWIHGRMQKTGDSRNDFDTSSKYNIYMIISALVLGASLAHAAAAPKVAPEERLRVLLANVKEKHVQATRDAVLGSANDLRDAVAKENGPSKLVMMNRLPGMAQEPFNLCRTLESCAEAPISLHVEEPELINDAFIALARPWFNLQKARNKDVDVSVDPGQGVRLKLQDSPLLKTVTLESAPAPTGGFDVTLREGTDAAALYASGRDALLEASPKK